MWILGICGNWGHMEAIGGLQPIDCTGSMGSTSHGCRAVATRTVHQNEDPISRNSRQMVAHHHPASACTDCISSSCNHNTAQNTCLDTGPFSQATVATLPSLCWSNIACMRWIKFQIALAIGTSSISCEKFSSKSNAISLLFSCSSKRNNAWAR